MTGPANTDWFNQTYEETHDVVKRAGRILLAHLCPYLQEDMDDLLSATYKDMSKKEWRLKHHPNITGWLIIAFRYVVYHRIRAWDKEHRAMEALVNHKRTELPRDPFEEAMRHADIEEIMRAAIANRRYALLRAYHVEGVPIRELAARTGRSVHAMESALSRWRKFCKNVLKSNRKLLLIFLWLAREFL